MYLYARIKKRMLADLVVTWKATWYTALKHVNHIMIHFHHVQDSSLVYYIPISSTANGCRAGCDFAHNTFLPPSSSRNIVGSMSLGP